MLDQLVWRTDRAGVQEKKAPPDPSVAVPATAPALPTPPPGAPGAASPNDMLQFIEISGHVNATQRSDYRSITAQVQRFADALQSDRSYELVRTQLPFDTTSAGTLSGDIGSSETDENPRFTVILSRRLGK